MALARLGSHISVVTLAQIMNPTKLSVRQLPVARLPSTFGLWACR